ncbi:DUF1566 domain-containing protein [Crocinitomicaceae bacterium]|nr:DUF1566 domain-containing protein [Crocinitomicaceae bacterium]MDC0257218.1 DUF1566 domain-containing protein [Crocinitomicaceae bacterium]
MKKLILSLVAIATIAITSFGQAPEGFKYQAVVRGAGNTILNNQAVGMRMTIQQGSIGGTTVYQETYAPTTNAYGLVNLEIGSGTVVSGDFTTIDWSAGPYFIETAVDATGGTSYAVMGTSQLMSVPYALHANTAENVTNDLVNDADADPSNEIQTISRTGTIVTLSNGGGSFTDSVGVYTGGAGIDITNNVVSTTSTCGLAIGQTYQGGIIFYLDPSGCHGLIAAPTDQSIAAQWYDGAGVAVEARAYESGLFAGKFNTINIMLTQFSVTCAAGICETFSLGGNSVWYLPSIVELDRMYQNIGPGNTLGLGNIGNFVTLPYWSSTEQSPATAISMVFANGSLIGNNKLASYHVRAVRAF